MVILRGPGYVPNALATVPSHADNNRYQEKSQGRPQYAP